MLRKIFKKERQIIFLLILFILLLTEFSFSGSRKEKESYFSVGSGYGIPYGVIGINCEVSPIFPPRAEKLQEFLGITFGLGYCPAGVAYAFGFNLYPLGREKMFQPKVSFYHGVVGTLNYYGNTERLKGLTLGSGLLVKLYKRYSIDFELIYLLHLFGWDFEDIGSRFKISVGARMHL
jgi:hypothetical protein